jgi:hypothetical protein
MEYVMRELTWKEKIKGHVTGPVGSIVFHIILIFVMIRYLTGDSDLLVRQTPVELKLDSKPIEIEKIKEIEVKEVQEITQDIDMTMPTEAFTMETAAPTDNVAAPSDTPVDLEALDVVSNVDSPVTISGIMRGRTAAGRAEGLAKFGGNNITEGAVMRALEWLKNNQNADGSWNDKSKVGNTGLAILTFLAHGETPASDKYGATVEKGIQYLVADMNDNGRFKGGSGHYVYDHAIATYALADSYSMTRVPILKVKLEKAVDVIIKGQQKGGGWDYGYNAASDRNDSSVSGWQVQALKAAVIAGASNPGLLEALNKSLDGLRSLQSMDSGMFGYTSPGGKNHGLTAVGVLAFQFVGQKESPEAKKGLVALREAQANYAAHGWPFYAWYYITQAKFNEGGADWKAWNPQIAKLLVSTQNKDGSWLAPAGAGGHGETGQGKTYATTLAALSLQVYYRLLPTFGEKALAAPVQPAGFEDAGDVNVTL